MKHILATLLLVVVTVAAQAQARNYFKVFDPNRNAEGAMLKNSPQKTVVVMTCDLVTLQPGDSANCLEDVKTFDDKGRLVEHYEFTAGQKLQYKYDDKDRVIEYTETQLSEGNVLMKLLIKYDKKGRITAITNTSDYVLAKTVVYKADEERLLISESLSFLDEIYFKGGVLQKVVNRNSSELILYTAEYERDKQGRITAQAGVDYTGGEYKYLITTVYNAKGQRDAEVGEYWNEQDTTDKIVETGKYFYDEKGNLTQKNKDTPNSKLLTLFKYNEKGLLETADYFDEQFLLVTLYYYYR